MAMVGGSIGLSFAVSLVLSPVLVGEFGLSGLFWAISLLGFICLLIAAFGVPAAPQAMQPIVQAKAEVALSPALVEQIHRDSKGRMRHVLNAIANIEVWAETNSWTEVDVAHVKGKSLCTDFTGHIAANKGV